MDKFYCDDLNEFSFPKNWEIHSRIDNEIINCEQSKIYENDFDFLRDLLENNIERLGVFKTIPRNMEIWNDRYTLSIDNRTTAFGQVCRNINHSMTIETDEIPMDVWQIPLYIKKRFVPFNQEANLMLEKPLFWVFPILKDVDNIGLTFGYLSVQSKIRTIDVRTKKTKKNIKTFINNNSYIPVNKFLLLNLKQNQIIKSTIQTLDDVNYEWPKLDNSSTGNFCSPVLWKETGPLKTKDFNCHEIKLNSTDQTPMISDILLVVIFNNPLYHIIPYVNNIYIKLFKHIVFCGPDKFPKDFQGHFVGYKNMKGYRRGSMNSICASVFLAMRHKYAKSLLTVSDDVIVNVHMLKALVSTNYLLYPPKNGVKESLWKWNVKEITSAMNDIFTSNDLDLRKCSKVLKRGNNYRYMIKGGFADVFYVPHTLSREFIKLNNLFIDRNVTFEIAIPTMLYCLQTFEYVNSSEIGATSRNKQWRKIEHFPKKLCVHPLKWGLVNKTKSDYHLWQNLYCRTKFYINDNKRQKETLMYFANNRHKLSHF